MLLLRTINYRILVVFILVLSVQGCGKPKVTRFDVAGTIRWDGKDIKSGYVTFNPDVKAGNRGPQGLAFVKDGKFDTRFEGGRGSSPGAQVLEVYGYDGVNPTKEHPHGKLVFAGFNTQEKIDAEKLDLKIDIPKGAVKTISD